MEVKNRATPETHQLLAFAQLQAGKNKEALRTIERFVVDKTFEPMALYYCALIYKANGLDNKVATIKEELIAASYELGPVMIKEVRRL
jgi:hypothetical protein